MVLNSIKLLERKSTTMARKETIIFVLLTCWMNSSAIAQLCLGKYQDKICSNYWVTEFGIGIPIHLKQKPDRLRNFDANINIGLMTNLSKKISIGGHTFIGYYKNDRDGFLQGGIRPRVTFRLKKNWAFNFSPGIILYTNYAAKPRGFSLESNLSWKDHFAITTRLDLLSFDEYDEESPILVLGLQTDGKKGIGLFLGAVATVLTLAIIQ